MAELEDNPAPICAAPTTMDEDDRMEAGLIHDQTAENNIKEREESISREKSVSKELIQDLCQAVLEGNWPDAEPVIKKFPDLVRQTLSHGDETALHIAAAAKKTAFVEKLIQRMERADLLLKNKFGYTALCYAAITGIVRIAEVMVLKNEDLPNVRANNDVLPILLSVTYKHKDMVRYLFSVTKFDLLETNQQSGLLIATISVDYYDIALDILKENPRLAIELDKNYDTALHVLARKPSAIGSRSELKIWEKCMKYASSLKGLYNKALMKTLAHRLVESLWEAALEELPHYQPDYQRNISDPIHRSLSRLLHDAARVGNVEFLIVLFRIRPDLIWRIDKNEKSIFHVAVESRQERVLNLIYVLGGLKDQIINHNIGDNYNMLHLAGKLAAPIHLRRVSGKALQMQHELLWFKEVEKIVAPFHLMQKCGKKALTPRELFTNEHSQLLKEGEEWLKNTANSCMLVATLIATVVFAAAFTVPGGTDNNNNTGIPVFQGRDWFTVFVISDAAALVSSSTSILMFLSILTSRYAEDDFLHSLPSKLLFGLASLFISIVCMVVAFSATFFMLYHNGKIWVPITVAAMTILPVSSFCVLQFRLWADTFRTTYFSRFRFKPHKPKLYEGVSIKLKWWTFISDLEATLVQSRELEGGLEE